MLTSGLIGLLVSEEMYHPRMSYSALKGDILGQSSVTRRSRWIPPVGCPGRGGPNEALRGGVARTLSVSVNLLELAGRLSVSGYWFTLMSVILTLYLSSALALGTLTTTEPILAWP